MTTDHEFLAEMNSEAAVGHDEDTLKYPPHLAPIVSSQWKDVKGIQHLAIAMLYPSGCTAKDIIVSVTPCRNFLKIVQTWPPQFSEPMGILKKWIVRGEITEDSAKMAGFQDAFKELKQSSNDRVKTEGYFSLPFEVQSRIMAKSKCDNDGALFMVVDLMAYVDEYVASEGESDFSVVGEEAPPVRKTKKTKRR